MEVSVHAVLGSHPELARLLDVGVTSTSVCLVTRLYEMSLRTFYLHGALEPEVVQHVLHSMCKALQHMHHSGLIHNDLKPDNVFVTPPPTPQPPTTPQQSSRGGCFSCHRRCALLWEIWALFFPGDPHQRRLPDLPAVTENGLQHGALRYRAPEILLGFASFSYPVDVWALGCVGAEVVSRAPLFQGNAAVILTLHIFKLFGRPSQGLLVDLPLFSKQSLAFEKQPWPPASLRTCQPELQVFVAGGPPHGPNGANDSGWSDEAPLPKAPLPTASKDGRPLPYSFGRAGCGQSSARMRGSSPSALAPDRSSLVSLGRKFSRAGQRAASPSASQSRGDRFEQDI